MGLEDVEIEFTIKTFQNHVVSPEIPLPIALEAAGLSRGLQKPQGVGKPWDSEVEWVNMEQDVWINRINIINRIPLKSTFYLRLIILISNVNW